MKYEWKDHGRDTFTANVIAGVKVNIIGVDRIYNTLKFRIQKMEHGVAIGWRVDLADLVGWTAIDDMVAFPTFEDAEAWVDTWLAAAREQRTLSPMVKRLPDAPR